MYRFIDMELRITPVSTKNLQKAFIDPCEAPEVQLLSIAPSFSKGISFNESANCTPQVITTGLF